MEFFAVLAVVIIICVILGVSTSTIIVGLLILAGLIIASCMFMFLFAVSRLLRSEKKEAVFDKVDKPENSRFRSAYYIVDGREYKCIFPSEPKGMYKKEKKCHVYLHSKTGTLFDRYAMITCVLGTILSVGLVAGILCFIYILFGI